MQVADSASLRRCSYYEAWAATQRASNRREISYLEGIVGSLAHLYVAFATIVSGTFEIQMMSNVPSSTILQIMNLKQKAPGLRICISIGGYYFSDNGTDTQPYGRRSRTKLNNLTTFMTTWDLDGINLDWECTASRRCSPSRRPPISASGGTSARCATP